MVDEDAARRDERRQELLARAFSREADHEEARDYHDPETGETLSMRPAEWELRALDRLEAKVAAAAGEPASPAAAAPCEAGPAVGAPAATAAAASPAPAGPPAAPRLRASAWFAGGVLAGIAATALATGLGGPGGPGGLEPGSPGDRTDDAPGAAATSPAEVEAVHAVFSDFPLAPPPAGVDTRGFDEGSFRLLERSDAAGEAVEVYAATRQGHRLCLVAVTASTALVYECASDAQIARAGIDLNLDISGPTAGIIRLPADGTESVDDDTLLTLRVVWDPTGDIRSWVQERLR